VHKKYASLPNMAVMGKISSAKSTEIGWRSTPNLMFRQVTSDMQIPESSGNRDSKCLLDGRLCISTTNIPARPNLAGDAPELQILNTTQDTDGGFVTVVKHRRERRSFWRWTKKFVRRLFCCCGSIDMKDQ